MTKTKEELKELTGECNKLAGKLKELSEDELEHVIGGAIGDLQDKRGAIAAIFGIALKKGGPEQLYLDELETGLKMKLREPDYKVAESNSKDFIG